MPDCTPQQLRLQGFGRREIVADFEGGEITSDGGSMLLGQVDRRRRVVERFAACFEDHRDAQRIEHSVLDLLRQRTYALALGYEDLNDHDELRLDALLATAVGKADPAGEERRRSRDRGRSLAGKSTLNRLELGAVVDGETDRYRRIGVSTEAVDRFFVEVFLDAHEEPPESIILDLDATDDPLHGTQEGRFYHGYYDCYCYLPLYIFCGDHLLLARLRRANQDASAGSVEELSRIVAQIRQAWPEVEIWVRGDSGFAREELMAWCEEEGVEYVFGLARNTRLQRALEPFFEVTEALCGDSGEPERVYGEWRHSTLKSWSHERRVIGKAEITGRGDNPRFVVTSLPAEAYDARTVYEEIYCARGDMENRIKEKQLDLFATRTSAHRMQVNQLRLWFASVAYLLMSELRRLALAGTSNARLRCKTIRLRLFKVGARVRVTRRRLWVHLSSSWPHRELFVHVYHRLQRLQPLAA